MHTLNTSLKSRDGVSPSFGQLHILLIYCLIEIEFDYFLIQETYLKCMRWELNFRSRLQLAIASDKKVMCYL